MDDERTTLGDDEITTGYSETVGQVADADQDDPDQDAGDADDTDTDADADDTDV